MKTIKVLLALLFVTSIFSACSEEDYVRPDNTEIDDTSSDRKGGTTTPGGV